jgi:adenylate cyclase
MRLNPYHPPRYWTHLGRALFHQARYDEALVAFDNVGRARKDDLAYRVAVNVRLGNEAGAAGAVAELGNRYPNFDATAFVGGLPFERREDRDALLEPLAEGLVDQKKIDPKSNV